MAKKIHTRAKRKLKLSTRYQHLAFLKSKFRKNRPKTFKTQESANKYAKEKGIEKYKLVKAKKDKKFKIVED